MRLPWMIGTIVVCLAARPSAIRAQQYGALSHEVARTLLVSAAYLRDQLAKGSALGHVEFDARSLTRLVADSAAPLRPRLAQALGIGLADESRLETCKPVHSVMCELGAATAVLEVRSAVVNGTHATVEIRKYERRGGNGTMETLGSTILRFSLTLTSGEWSVTKMAIVSG